MINPILAVALVASVVLNILLSFGTGRLAEIDRERREAVKANARFNEFIAAREKEANKGPAKNPGAKDL